ncbi:MAG: PQQ-like beta-propeller repeat protein [bacterium]|nr:PQQ-like beta-propeller repeat protein [bacterium]
MNCRSIPLALSAALLTVPVAAQDWPGWRGPAYNGTASASGLPTDFSPEKRVRWALDLPGPGASTPIVVGNRVFLSSTDVKRDRLMAMCIDRTSGEVRWSHDAGSGFKDLETATRIARIDWTKTTYASPSPVTDGERVIFFFGNGDLVGYDLDGSELWRRNIQQEYGKFAFNWTFSASPTLFDGTLYLPVLQRDVPIVRKRRGGGRSRVGSGGGKPAAKKPAAEEAKPKPIESFILAMDPATGKTRYKHVRPSPAKVESLESYTSLVPFKPTNGKQQMLLVGGDVLTGHDPKTGEELWRWGTWNEGHRERFWRLVPTVVTGEGMALVCAPKKAPVYAIKLGADGMPAETPLAWRSEGRRNPVSSDVPTPAFFDGHFYVLSDVRSALSKVRARDGEVIWTSALPKDHRWRSSPTVADGKVWLMNHNGLVVVVDAAGGDVVHQVAMAGEDDDYIRSSLVVAHDSLFVRTNFKLFCIGQVD